MKSFKEWLAEAEHYIDGYNKWGIISPDHKMVSGSAHPTATTHDNLYKGGISKNKSVEYAQDSTNDSLSIRTRSQDGLKLAIKHFARLPHMRTGMVTHTHFGLTGMTETSGKSYEILAKMKELGKK